MKKITVIILALFVITPLFAAVEFLGLSAEAQEMNVLLSWSTATETENVGFILERKSDSLATWNTLVTYLQNDALLGQGTISSQTDYSFMDTTTTTGTYFYRISGVDEASAIGRLDSLSITVGETKIEEILPNEFELTCYPNPFNPSVAINFSIFAKATMDGQLHVKVLIFDLQGRLIEELVNSDMSAGSYELVWNARAMPSGVYLVKMYVNDMVTSNKIVLLK